MSYYNKKIEIQNRIQSITSRVGRVNIYDLVYHVKDSGFGLSFVKSWLKVLEQTGRVEIDGDIIYSPNKEEYFKKVNEVHKKKEGESNEKVVETIEGNK